MSDNRRVMIFIDGSNVYHGMKTYEMKNNTRLSIDYPKLIERIVAGRQLVRATYYCSRPEDISSGQKKFHEYLRECRIQVVDKLLKERPGKDGSIRLVEKGVDVALAIDLLGMAWEDVYDVGVVVSGDADYVGAIRKVMDKGKNVEVYSFRGQLSRELKESAITATYLDDIIDGIKSK